ncbi:hypothetical protein [Kitasatospora terrestris]|uniref:hypothetical protein n=1 Tax=Kitasatospora terrestris TaxID=258051 RepID=UPI0031E9D3ED
MQQSSPLPRQGGHPRLVSPLGQQRERRVHPVPGRRHVEPAERRAQQLAGAEQDPACDGVQLAQHGQPRPAAAATAMAVAYSIWWASASARGRVSSAEGPWR